MSPESHTLTRHNTITSEFSKLIEELQEHTDIEALDLSGTKLPCPQAQQLASVLSQLTHLKVLNLSGVKLNNKGGAIIVKAIPESIEILILNGGLSQDGWIQNLCKTLKDCHHLKKLYLLENAIHPKNVELIHLQLLCWAPLKALHISCSEMPKLQPKSLVTEKIKEIAEYKLILFDAEEASAADYMPLGVAAAAPDFGIPSD